MDYELEACLEYTQKDITCEQVETVFAFVPGEHDSTDYFWILGLKDGTIGLLRGGCDYTGWD